jgi:hypothetical protein
MKFDEEDFDMMLNAAWSAFENTLFVWGVTQEQIDKFVDRLDNKDGFKAVDDSLSEVIEWRN